jgi:ADP-heptose:LPS heptosyltransferase
MPETSPSVLLIRLDAIGDALALTPLLAALTSAGIPADLVLRRENAAVFSSRAARRIDVAPWSLRSGQRDDDEAVQHLAADLATRNYTHALIATEDPSGYRLARAARIPERVGFENGWGKPFKTLWTRSLLTRTIFRSAGPDVRGRHECEVLFELGNGFVSEPVPTVDIARLRPLVLESEELPDARIAFQVTDKWERLGMSLDDVVSAFRESRSAGQLAPIAAVVESTYADRFERAAGVTVERFERIEDWKAFIGRAAGVVAPDSGAVHVAGTIGTPVVAVFPDDALFSTQTARWRPWAASHRIVRAGPDWPQQTGRSLRELLPATSGRY